MCQHLDLGSLRKHVESPGDDEPMTIEFRVIDARVQNARTLSHTKQ
jgi:hypothetical protein